MTFVVELTDGTIIHHHLNQLKLNMTDQTQYENEPFTSSDTSIPGCIPSSEVTTPELRHSSHIRYPPSHFSLDQGEGWCVPYELVLVSPLSILHIW